METIHFSFCPICGSNNIQDIIRALDHTVSGESFQIIHCNTCSVRFTQDIPNAENISRYYQSSKYISHTDTRNGLVNKMYHLVRRITLKQKRRLVERVSVKGNGKLLDVGAGTGTFVQTMSAAGWNAMGLEPDEGARRIAAASNILLEDPSNLFSKEKNSFAVITLWHVLEHVHRLHEYIDQFQELLSASGTLIIAVPNYTSNDASHYGSNWAAYDVPRHLYHFSPHAMQSLLNKHRFSLTHILPQWFDSYYVSMLSEQYKTGQMNLLKGVWQGFVSNVVALTNKDRCSSLIYVFRKQGIH